MNEPQLENDNGIMETLNSIQAAMTGLETLKKQFFEYDLFKSVWNLGYTEGFYNLLKGIFMSDNAHNYIADENIKDAIQDLQNKMKEAQDSLQKTLKDKDIEK